MKGLAHKAECKDCSAGRYSSETGVTSNIGCTACPEGYFSNTSGQISQSCCVPCPDGMYSAKASTQVSECHAKPVEWPLMIGSIAAAIVLFGGLSVCCFFKVKQNSTQIELGTALLEATREQYDLETTERVLGWLVFESEIQYEKVIGRGAFGEVWLAQWKGSDVAVKKMYPLPKDDFYPKPGSNSTTSTTTSFSSGTNTTLSSPVNPSTITMLKNIEVDVMMKLRHPRIVAFLGAGEVVDPIREGEDEPRRGIFVLLEFVGGGDLQQLLARARATGDVSLSTTILPWSLRVQCACDIAEGMAFIHSKGLLHRDLKSLNVLVDHNGRCKIADLGLARKLTPDVRSFGVGEEGEREPMLALEATTMAGTVQWMAPEVVKESYGRKADVFSFGMVLWELLTCRIPWENDERCTFLHHILLLVREGLRPQATEKELSGAPEGFLEVMEKCWASDADARPTFKESLVVLRGILKREMSAGSVSSRQKVVGDESGTKVLAGLQKEIDELQEAMVRKASAEDYVGAERLRVKRDGLLKRMSTL